MHWLKRKKLASLIVKAASGGGGRGMRIVERVDTLLESVQAAQRDAEMWFGDDTVYMERFLQKPRHVEVQVLVMVMVMRFIYMTVTVHYNVVIKKC
jgi:acetyl/propionyl-CoA carboxylase alpha subunit